ncbi:MAG: response regulator [Candidatus Parcubacteria bacterium]|nr:response regulator [Candidatus Parcubacteria bacterium]
MSNKKYKVLMVEDDPDQIMMYQTQFELEGFKFFNGKKYSEIREIIEKESPDIILLDLILGAEVGTDILKVLKKEKITDKIPVFIFTNLKDGKSDEEYMKMGARGYWTKTKYMPKQLCEMITKFLSKKA